MASIPKNHDGLYFDKLVRTQKMESVLSLIQATLLLLVQNDGGYAITYGCSHVVVYGNTRIETYYSPFNVKSLLEELENE